MKDSLEEHDHECKPLSTEFCGSLLLPLLHCCFVNMQACCRAAIAADVEMLVAATASFGVQLLADCLVFCTALPST